MSAINIRVGFLLTTTSICVVSGQFYALTFVYLFANTHRVKKKDAIFTFFS